MHADLHKVYAVLNSMIMLALPGLSSASAWLGLHMVM